MKHIFWHGFGWTCDFGMDRVRQDPGDIHVKDWHELPEEEKKLLELEMCSDCVRIRKEAVLRMSP